MKSFFGPGLSSASTLAVKSKINELMFVKALKEPLTVVDDE